MKLDEPGEAEAANELVLRPTARDRVARKARLVARFPRPHDLVYDASIQALRDHECEIVKKDKVNLHIEFALDDVQHDLMIFPGNDGHTEMEIKSRTVDPRQAFELIYTSIAKDVGKYLTFANASNSVAESPKEGKRRKAKKRGNSGAGSVCSVLSIIFGGVAFLLCPPLFGLAGLVLGIIGTVMSKNKTLGVLGIILSVFGTIIGMIIGAALVGTGTSKF